MADDTKTLEDRVKALEEQLARATGKGGKEQGLAEATTVRRQSTPPRRGTPGGRRRMNTPDATLKRHAAKAGAGCARPRRRHGDLAGRVVGSTSPRMTLRDNRKRTRGAILLPGVASDSCGSFSSLSTTFVFRNAGGLR